MQWNSKPNSGFTTGEPWLHIHKDYKVRNVENQSSSSASLLNCYKELIKIRRDYPALNAGEIELVPATNEDLLVYSRTKDTQEMLVVLNFSKQITTYELPTEKFNQWELLYAGNEDITSHMAENELHLPAYGFAILISRSE